MSDNRRRSLPPVPPTLDKQLRPLISALSEIVETGEGVRGDPMDRKLTYRDLVDNGFAKLRPGARPGNPGSLEPDIDPPPPNRAKPPKPEGFAATGGFNGRISLTWTIPGNLYSNHGMTRIFRAETDNLANANEIGKEAGAFFTDTARDDTEPKTYFYWIRFVSDADVEGPPSDSVTAAPLEDTAYIIEQITGEIRESQLAQELNSRIDLIDGPESLDGSVASRIATESEQRADADSALSQQITTVQTQVDDNVTSIQEQATAVDGLEAQYSVKIDANGAVAGFGLASTPSDETEDGSFSEFYVNADRFAVLPQDADPENAVAPFIVQDGDVFIDSARIREGSIQQGQIGPIGFGKIVDADNVPVTTVDGRLKADFIEADSLEVASAATFHGDAKSSNYEAGSQGWIIQQNGFVEFNNAQIRGNVDLDSITVNGELPEAGESLEADPQSYSSSLGTSGRSETLAFSDSASFDKVPEGASLNIDYVFDGEIQLSLGSPGDAYEATHTTSDTSYGSLPLEEAGDTYTLTYFDPSWSISIPNNGYIETRNTYDSFDNIDGREGDFYRVNRLRAEFRGSGTIEFKVIVDGEVVFSDSKSISVNENLESSWSGSTTDLGSISRQTSSPSQRLQIPLNTVMYTYPEYKEQSTVEVEAEVSISGMRYEGGEPTSSNRYLQMNLRSAGASFNLSRL